MAENHTDDVIRDSLGHVTPSWDDSAAGMSVRDYFAGQASEADIDPLLGDTVGEVARKLAELGFIPPPDKQEPQKYTPADYLRLRAWARYEFADFMLAERKRRAEGKE